MKDNLKNFLPENHGEISTIFNIDTDFDGVLSFDKPLRINGKFKGKINSSASLVIGNTAEIKADIEAEDNLDIVPSGKLYGNIRASKLKFADGVIFEGSCEMIKPGESPRQTAVSSELPPKQSPSAVSPAANTEQARFHKKK
mgnify:CR=1 FL=1